MLNYGTLSFDADFIIQNNFVKSYMVKIIIDNMKKLIITVLVIILLPILISAQEKTNNANSISEDTDIHYTGKYCEACHENTPKKGGEKFLKFDGDFGQLCKCHGYTPGTYIHPAGIVPSEEKKASIPKEFPLEDGKLSCITCHDIYLQCQKNPQFKALNRRFLRGAPYVSRTTLCFRCHDEKKYTMLDPHNQLTETGAIIIDKCLYCHTEKPDEKTATFKEVHLIGNLEVLPPAILNNMKSTENKFGIILPLNYEGKITCPTCHNPHERGVIPRDRASAKGASEKYRLRLSEVNLQICVACHKDKF
ncbi:MAG: hypothetical protein HY757_02885 [Nitrospirae bacterium]|nr:hypothetical protein [Nitrospirota bacterium]